MPYTKQQWANDTLTAPYGPLSAARLAYIEDGIATAQATAEGKQAPLPAGAADDAFVFNGTAWVPAKLVNANIAANAGIAVSKLAPGTNGYILSVVAGVVTWVAPDAGGGTTTPPSTSPAAPAAPGATGLAVTTITDQTGLGVNNTSYTQRTDYVIDGTGDTGLLYQFSASDGSTAGRFRMRRIGALASLSYGVHGVYGKAANLLLEDFDIQATKNSLFSMRYPCTVRRFIGSGAYSALTYYETSPVFGSTVLFEDGNVSFTGDTGFWVDAETDYQPTWHQNFIFRRVWMTGPGAFAKCAIVRNSGSTFRFEQCRLNGNPITSADIPGIPSATIVN